MYIVIVGYVELKYTASMAGLLCDSLQLLLLSNCLLPSPMGDNLNVFPMLAR